MSGYEDEKSMLPYIIGAVILFFVGTAGTTYLPFYDDQMQAPNQNAELRHLSVESSEYRGREVYIREGCHTCHTMFVRPVLADSSLGPISQPADYYYDAPAMLGTKRTGADLMWVGNRWNEDWHREHLLNPQKVLPGSIMPRYDYLSDQDLEDLIAYLMSLKPSPQTEGRPVE
ncbi:cbb3-type cytochrome c oxidase subunit II [Salipaludibacillus aurantiacus]|uniref:Cytochrome c oxidase cbb3-type subunit 2 n=1 Tax=Salipaludibacillus aurantiacus TaxID=1601833 RepID=A0A1H9T0J3_9BACI|nr:cbb3-type cytochrome c oxidase subunit II [Salipaludibacillus aurantiacus]SER90745.1 cytochrome c oxidase cbb3-type subunit 2 [Salipaludibacillus aurantiacus]